MGDQSGSIATTSSPARVRSYGRASTNTATRSATAPTSTGSGPSSSAPAPDLSNTSARSSSCDECRAKGVHGANRSLGRGWPRRAAGMENELLGRGSGRDVSEEEREADEDVMLREIGGGVMEDAAETVLGTKPGSV